MKAGNESTAIGDRLNVEVVKTAATTWIRPHGRIDAANWDAFAAVVRTAANHRKTVYLDLSGVDAYDRDTTTSIVTLWREIAGSGTTLRFGTGESKGADIASAISEQAR